MPSLFSTGARTPLLPQPATHPLSTHSASGGKSAGGGGGSTHSAPTFTNVVKSNLRRLPRRNAVQRALLAILLLAFIGVYVYSEHTDRARAERLADEQRVHAWLSENGDEAPFRPKQPPSNGHDWKSGGSAAVSSAELLEGLPVYPDNDPNARPLTDLGREADATFHLGPRTLKAYVKSLTAFVGTSLPESIQADFLEGIRANTGGGKDALWSVDKFGGGKKGRDTVWMTDRNNAGHEDSEQVRSWRDNDEGWKWELLDDTDAHAFAMKSLGKSRFGKVWQTLPNGIMHSDTLRYLLLALSGGVYSDTDTKLLKPISAWTNDYDLWRDGKGWLTPADQKKLETSRLPPPSVVVGIEADVGMREDWHDYWPRPLQIVQWTIAAAPHHPILIDALHMIQRKTATGLQWLSERPLEIARLTAEGDIKAAAKLSQVALDDEPSEGGPLGVMEWTGPGLWTDCVLRYLRVRYGIQWPELRNLRKPLRVGEVLILPVTGFSPGVGNFGAGEIFDDRAMVQHYFAGTWKDE